MPSSSLTGRSMEWMPNGFPPRSFPPGGMLPPPEVPPPPRPPREGRGKWLAAAAAFVALLLLIAGLVAAQSGDGGGGDLVASSTTTGVDSSLPAFDATTTPFVPAPSIEPVVPTTPAATTTVAPGGGSVPGQVPPVPAGVLEPSLAVLALPKADATAGAARGTLLLRNTGASPVTFTVTSSAAGLSAAPTRGILSPATAVTITVTLDAVRVDAEGPFGGTLTFGGAEVAKTVQVQSVVGRPPQITDGVGESCPAPSATCSRQIKLAPTSDPASPCDQPWLYSVMINDQSRIQTSRVIARLGAANADVQLRRGGTSNIFQSEAFIPLPAGAVLRFTVEAIDEHGFGRRLAEEMIACP